MRLLLKYLVISLFIFSINTVLASETKENKHYKDSTKKESFFIYLETGYLLPNKLSNMRKDLGMGIKFTYKKELNSFSISYHRSKELGIFLEDKEVNFSDSFVLTYGRNILPKRKFALIPAVGISIEDGRYRTEYENYSWDT